MSAPLKINLSKPVTSVKILENNKVPSDQDSLPGRTGAEPNSHEHTDSARLSSPKSGQISEKELESQKSDFLQACQTLNNVTDKLNQFCTQLFSEHKKEVAGLSVEIARKILVQKVENGDYKIESIVQEALNNVPTRQDIIVHLNPDDFASCQKAQQDEPVGIFNGIKLVPDPKIGRAECLLESPKGIIESLINEQLEKVGKALQKAG